MDKAATALALRCRTPKRNASIFTAERRTALASWSAVTKSPLLDSPQRPFGCLRVRSRGLQKRVPGGSARDVRHPWPRSSKLILSFVPSENYLLGIYGEIPV